MKEVELFIKDDYACEVKNLGSTKKDPCLTRKVAYRDGDCIAMALIWCRENGYKVKKIAGEEI